MTPKEKAIELTKKFILQVNDEDFGALKRGKECAKIAVTEIIAFSKSHSFSIREDNVFWVQVLKEIELL